MVTQNYTPVKGFIQLPTDVRISDVIRETKSSRKSGTAPTEVPETGSQRLIKMTARNKALRGATVMVVKFDEGRGVQIAFNGETYWISVSNLESLA